MKKFSGGIWCVRGFRGEYLVCEAAQGGDIGCVRWFRWGI